MVETIQQMEVGKNILSHPRIFTRMFLPPKDVYKDVFTTKNYFKKRLMNQKQPNHFLGPFILNVFTTMNY